MGNLRTRQPTGAVPWPLLLVEGAEKAALEALPERFWAKVNFDGPLVLATQCWVWTGANTGTRAPYGVSWDGQRRVKAHRWSWEAGNGPIPDGLQMDHLCKTTLCVRPGHLEPVSLAENVRRGDAPGPRAVRDNTCKRGHEFTPDNTYVKPDGGRECRACTRVNKREAKRRRRLARKAAQS